MNNWWKWLQRIDLFIERGDSTLKYDVQSLSEWDKKIIFAVIIYYQLQHMFYPITISTYFLNFCSVTFQTLFRYTPTPNPAHYNYPVFNRPGLPGAVLHTPLLLISWLIQSSFSFQSSRHHHFQTVRARELTFWENVHPSPPTCHMSRVTCHVLCHFFSFLLLFWTKWWNQLGLPRLFFFADPGKDRAALHLCH